MTTKHLSRHLRDRWSGRHLLLAAVMVWIFPTIASASIIASDDFDGYKPAKALAGQGAPGYGWYAGWAANPGVTLNAVVTDSTGTTDMNYTPGGGTAIPGDTNSVDMTSGGDGLPVVSRQLFRPQTGTFYAACALRFQAGNVNTYDTFGFCLNSDPDSLLTGVNIGYYGVPGGSYFYLRRGLGTPPNGPLVGNRNGIHYLVVKVEKTGPGNYNQVTLWADPDATSETSQPNGDFQLTTDLNIASISQVGLFGQGLDSGDRCRLDSLALATTFADLMAPAGPGPAGSPPVNTIRVEAAADGSANTAVPTQNLLLGQALTNYAIARNGSGVFLSNTPASWLLTNITGSVVAGDLVAAADRKSALFTAHMAGSAKILAVGVATNLVTSGVITVPAGIDQFDSLRLYWWTNIIAGSASPSTVANDANGYWTTMNTNASRTCLWSDRPFGVDSWNIVSTFTRLGAMAMAWAKPGCSLQGNTNLANAVISGLDWMVANIYTPTATEYGNWFHWQDSGPNYFESTIVLIYPALTSQQIGNYCASIDHFNPAGWMTGANMADKIQIMAIRGILGKSASKMVTARDQMSALFPFVTSGEGFYSDGSFVFHDAIAYNGGYGVDLLGKIPTMFNLLKDSQWAITDPSLTNVFFWVTAGYEPFFYNGNFMDLVRGRSVAVSSAAGTGGDVLNAIRQIADFAPLATAAAFNAFANSPRLTSGQFHFPNMDRVVAQRSSFAFGLSLSSSRIFNYESINGNNLHGWFTGDGMTYLYVGSGESQFSGDFWPTVDPYHLPGTTVETNALADAVGQHALTDQNWVGGAQVAGTYGVAGMSLHPVAATTTLYGKKSWFMLDNEIVCLGAGITCGDAVGVHTTAENRRLGAPITPSFTLNGTPITPTVGWSSNLPSATASWCALSGTGGYYFPAGQSNLQATFTANSGSWAQINAQGGSPTVYTDNYLKLWYNHGLHPTNATYAYVLLPNLTAGSVSNYALNPDILILTNTASIQAVKKPALGVVAANFWTTGTNSADLITVNNKASVIVCDDPNATFAGIYPDTISVGVSDPTQTNAGTITVTINLAASGLVSADPGVTVLQLAPKIILSVNVNGAQGRSFQAAFSGLLPAVTYWNLPGGGSWATATNWAPATTPNAAGVMAFFGGGGTPITGPSTVTLDGNKIVGGINFSNGVNGFTVNPGIGGTLTLDNTPNPGLVADQAGSHVLAVPLALPAAGVGVNVVSASSLGLSGVISGPGGLTSIGGGTLTLSAANTYAGDTLISAGTLQLGDGTANNGSVAGNITDNAALMIANPNAATYSRTINGTGTLTKLNTAGLLTLAGTNSYSGGTTISTSLGATNALLVSNSLALGTGPVSIGGNGNADGSCLKLAGGITIANLFNSWASRNGASPNLLNVSGTNTVTSSLSAGSGGNQSTLQSDSGNLVLLGAIGTRQLNLQGAGNGELRGAVNLGANNLVKSGSGAWTLSGTNTYTNSTIINGGTLWVNGRNAGGDAVTVNSGGKLGGQGILTGPVTVASGGTFAPGTDLGSLTISNTLTLRAGCTTLIELNKSANTNDSVRGLSAVSYNGTLQVTNLGGTLANGDAFKLFYASSYAGTFATLSPTTPAAGLRWNTNTLATDGTLRITNAPVPRIAQVALQNGSLVLGVTNGTPGMTLYVQANTNLSNPAGWARLSTNVFDNSGGLLWSNQITPGAPATFFRIEAP